MLSDRMWDPLFGRDCVYVWLAGLSERDSYGFLIALESYGKVPVDEPLECFGCSTSCFQLVTLEYWELPEKYTGIIAASSGRIDGKHAQIIPILVSIADSMAAGGLSKVGSVELETETKV